MFKLGVTLSFIVLAVSAVSSEWIERHDLTYDSFNAENSRFSSLNYSLTTLCGYSNNNTVNYHALWEKDMIRGEIIARARMTLEEFQKYSQLEYLSPNYPYVKYSLVYACGYVVSGVPYFSAIWERRPSHFYQVQIHVTRSTLQNYVYEYKTGRLLFRLSFLNGYTLNNTDYYIAVWEQTSAVDDWKVLYRINKQQFTENHAAFSSKGYRLKASSGYELDNTINYAAVWEKVSLIDPVPLKEKHGMIKECFEDELVIYKSDGYKPRFINVFGSSKNVMYNVIWEKEDTKNNFSIKSIDNVVRDYLNKNNAIGLSLAITKDERLVYNKAYGRVDSSINEPLSIYNSIRMGSISKTFAALGVLKLIELGHLKSLDQKVFGPDSIFGFKYFIPDYNYENITKVTVRSLLNHRSGIAPTTSDEVIDFFYNKDSDFNEIINYYMKNRRLFSRPPESKVYQYCNQCFLILGLVIEHLTSEPYECYLKTNILTPMGIGSGMFLGSSDGYYQAPKEAFYTPGGRFNTKFLAPTGGWVGRSKDIARMMVSIDGMPYKKDILGKDLLDEMKRDETGENRYGLGLQLNRFPGSDYGHSGRIQAEINSYTYNYKNGVTMTILPNTDLYFNYQITGQGDLTEIYTPLAEAIDGIKDWPEIDLF